MPPYFRQFFPILTFCVLFCILGSMIHEEIESALFALQDKEYRTFTAKLIPTVPARRIIGVRTPELRSLAKTYIRRDDISAFLTALPHRYFEENQLHAFLLCEMKDFDRCVEATAAFLPYIDNWATCDQLSPKVFAKHKAALLEYIRTWLDSNDTYTVRFAVGMLMEHFLDADFSPAYLQTAAAIRSDEYYVNMMVAWYFATALAKQYEAALPLIEQHALPPWTHNKAIRKAIESRRIPDAHKAYLRTLK